MQYQTNRSGIIELTSAEKIKRACSVIIPLCFLSILLAAAIISVGNDMYAFVKREEQVNLYFENSSSVYSVAQALEANGIINNPSLFSLYVKSKGGEGKLKNFSGEIILSTDMSYREILKAFS